MESDKYVVRFRAGEEIEIVRKPGHAESISELYGGKNVEIFIDGAVGRRLYSDHEHDEVLIIDCFIKGAHGDMLIVDIEFETIDGTQTREVLLNGWMIKSIMIKDERAGLTAALNLNRKKLPRK
jgi:hypothetical protein